MTVSEANIKGNEGIVSVHAIANKIVLPASAIFLLIILLSRVFGQSKYLSFLPDSVTIIMASMMLGVGVRKAIQWGYIDFHQFTLINSVVLNLFLLPIIIFNSGWALNKRNFVSQIEHVHIFAVFGTLISTFTVGGLSYILATKGWHKVTDFRSNMVFGALISAVDPVATLSTYAKLGLPETQPLLHTLVFGESAINDAVAIVIFDVVNEGWDDLSLVNSSGKIAKLLGGSLFVGVFVAGLMMFLMKKARLKGDTQHEILFLHMSAYCMFAIAESLHLSGIIAGLFGGMLFGTYGPCLLTKEGNELATEFLEISGMSADTWVFILCGTSTALLNKQDGVLFGMIGVILCLIARGISVPSCSLVCNFIKKNKFGEGKTQMITPAHQIMMWHGGLRGGIALVLALEVDATWCQFKGAILNGTFLIICTLLLMLGSTTELLLKKVGLQPDDDDAGKQEPPADMWSEDFYTARVCAAIDPLVRPILVGHEDKHRE
jgi:NhaP-type Na+/H+ or K+/H+ antiporter